MKHFTQWYFSLTKSRRAVLGCLVIIGVFVAYGLCSAAQQSRAAIATATPTTIVAIPTQPMPIPTAAPTPTPKPQSHNSAPVSCFSQQHAVTPAPTKTPGATPMSRKVSR